MKRPPAILGTGVLLTVLAAALGAHASAPQRTHRLEAGPATVAYGYYWSEAEPVLRIASPATSSTSIRC